MIARQNWPSIEYYPINIEIETHTVLWTLEPKWQYQDTYLGDENDT